MIFATRSHMRVRKRPVVVEAIRYTGENRAEVFAWAAEAQARNDPWEIFPNRTLGIPTLEGVMTAIPGDWIICGVRGECYPCKAEIFEATYEIVRTSRWERAWRGSRRWLRARLTAWTSRT